jgi:cob(I)alamin adenosyltransferase
MPSHIYTRRGDKGYTSLVDGSRVPKDAGRVEAYGTVDEANAWAGAARVFVRHALLDSTLEVLQHRLYNCSSSLATPPGAEIEAPGVSEEDLAFLEQAIDRFEEATGPLTKFVVPGGGRAASMLHVARTVIRRAERDVVALAADEAVDTMVIKFLNRSSDFLFAAARYANHVEDIPDVCWDRHLPLPDFS